jgi:hypothetical protein
MATPTRNQHFFYARDSDLGRRSEGCTAFALVPWRRLYVCSLFVRLFMSKISSRDTISP